MHYGCFPPHSLAVDARTRKNAFHPSHRILHVGRGVAGELQHLVKAKRGISRTVLREIGILDRTNANRFSNLPPIGLAPAPGTAIPLAVGDDLGRPLNSLIEQGFQTDGIASPRFKRPTVFAQHGAKGDVHKLQSFRSFGVAAAPELGRGKKLLKVLTLPMIDDIENLVGLPMFNPPLNRG